MGEWKVLYSGRIGEVEYKKGGRMKGVIFRKGRSGRKNCQLHLINGIKKGG